MTTDDERVTAFALKIGLAVPISYYGAQVVAAPFYPRYNFVRDMASELGSASAPHPGIWNDGMILLGLATIFAAVGFLRGFRLLGTPRVLAWLSALGVLSTGCLTLMSGLFHLGDPRHNGGPLPIGALLLPFFFAASVWKRGDARRVRISLVAGGILVVVMAPIMGQAAELGLDDIRGLLQRVLTLGLFPPIGLVAWYLIQGIREVASDHDSTVSLPAIT